MLSSVMEKFLFHSIGGLNFPSYAALLDDSSNQNNRSALFRRARPSSACVGVESRPNSAIAQMDNHFTTDPIDVVATLAPRRPPIAASVRGSVSSPL